METRIKQLRLDLDGLSKLVEQLEETYPTLASDSSLIMAKAWAGKLLGEFNVPSPYKNDGNRNSVSDIEPTDSIATTEDKVSKLAIEAGWNDKNYVQKVDFLRGLIEQTATELKSIGDSNNLPGREAAICRTQAWVYVVEAKLHLGFELQRLREQGL